MAVALRHVVIAAGLIFSLSVSLSAARAHSSSAVSEPSGAVASYDMSASQGRIVPDLTGNGHDATIEGSAAATPGDPVQLEGTESYISVPPIFSGASPDQLAIAISCRPESMIGGLFAFVTGDGWNDQRFVLGINSFYQSNAILAVVANGHNHLRVNSSDQFVPGKWTHYVLSIDDRNVTLYCNGVSLGRLGRSADIDVAGIPLWIGRNRGLGHPFFTGAIGDVRVYDRGLSETDVIQLFKLHSQKYGRSLDVFEQPSVAVQQFTEPGWIVVRADCGLMRPLEKDSRVQVVLRRPGGGEILIDEATDLSSVDGRGTVKLNAADLVAGDYELNAQVIDLRGQRIGEPAVDSVNWPGQDPAFRNVRIHNNLVWDLLTIADQAVSDEAQFVFNSPKRRWVLLRCDARLEEGATVEWYLDSNPASGHRLTLDHTHPQGYKMLYLPAGRHVLHARVGGKAYINEMLVRSIPEIIYSEYGSQPNVSNFGPFKGDFLDRYILPHTNTLVIQPSELNDPQVRRFREQGGRILVHSVLPGVNFEGVLDSGDKVTGISEALGYVRATAGFSAEGADGAILDEFGDSDPDYALYAEAIRQLAGSDTYAGRRFYPYANALYTGAEGRALLDAIVETGSAIAWKNYHPVQADGESARQYLAIEFIDRAHAYRAANARALESIAVCFGYFSAPPEFLNIYPEVNYKYALMEQVEIVANDPAFWGTYGLQSYLASYCDEETVRWMAELFRHYGIEGATDSMVNETYLLPHVANGDFANGTASWTVNAAAPGSLECVTQPGLGWLQGRYPFTEVGDTALRLRIDANKPNRIEQQIKALKPGALYTLRFFSADGKDMSREELHGLHVEIVDGTILPEQSFVAVVPNCYSHHFGPFDHKNNAYVNYYWQQFRAEGETATLIISDWREGKPVAEPGQEFLLNFVQVVPHWPRPASE